MHALLDVAWYNFAWNLITQLHAHDIFKSGERLVRDLLSRNLRRPSCVYCHLLQCDGMSSSLHQTVFL